MHTKITKKEVTELREDLNKIFNEISEIDGTKVFSEIPKIRDKKILNETLNEIKNVPKFMNLSYETRTFSYTYKIYEVINKIEGFYDLVRLLKYIYKEKIPYKIKNKLLGNFLKENIDEILGLKQFLISERERLVSIVYLENDTIPKEKSV